MAGKGIIKKTERNFALVNDFVSGVFTIKELVEKYGITKQRIYAIIKKYR
jgi:Mor family transcriptional regulator